MPTHVQRHSSESADIMRRFIFIVISLMIWQSAPGQKPESPSKKPLNVLLITADDLGLQLGCYGDRITRTPHLDRLAGQSVLFENAYVTQASCSPSRSSILTGYYPHQNGQIGLSHLGYRMYDNVATLPQILRKHHYAQAILGKLHIAPEAHFPFDVARLNARQTRDVAVVAAQAKAFMDTIRQPFFLMVNYFDPHAELVKQMAGLPLQPFTADEVAPFPFQQVNTSRELNRIADYYSCVARLDAGIGMLLAALEQSGQASNTLVVFLGDHGPPFNRAKTNCYEAGLKIPLLIRWPGKPASRYKGLVSTIDLVPTILETLGLPVASSLPGHSLTPLVAGKSPVKRPYLFGEFNAHGPLNFYPMRSVRDERYKLIVNYLPEEPFPALHVDGDMAWEESQRSVFDNTPVRKIFAGYRNRPALELYDLQKDPDELTNLAGKPKLQKKIKELQQALQNWQAETNDPVADPAKFARMVEVHQAMQKQAAGNPDFRPSSPILWTNY